MNQGFSYVHLLANKKKRILPEDKSVVDNGNFLRSISDES